MKFRYYIALPLLAMALLAALAHYFHWDNRLVQVVREQQTPEYKREASIWLNRYNADISGKPLDRLLKDELSGLTWHAPSNTLFSVTGKIPKLVQLSLDGELLREIHLTGVADPEGVEALSDGRFAMVDERRGKLILFSLPLDNELDLDQALQLDLGGLEDAFMYPRNKGLEGIAWDSRNSRFILAKERDPHALYSMAFDLETSRAGPLVELPAGELFMRDISGLDLDPNTGHLLVLSDESRMLLELDSKGEPVSFMSFMTGFNGLGQSISQAEGVAMDARGVIYVVGEPNLFYRFVPDPAL
ncbi:MAG: SdiA-regulated domain-containing protein [Gammaproteobacteria bacterium]|nr:SdiA-regulated domain-containing protein [Gammaproteobacteria bacterium]